MPAIKYRVMLTEDEKAGLEALLRKGESAARKQARARVLLKAAEGWRDEETARAVGVSTAMVARARQRCVEEGAEAALRDRPRPGQKRKLTDRQAAHIIAIACGDAPTGHGHWTPRLLAGRVVELEYAESCGHGAIRQLLKKHPQAPAARGMAHSPRSARGSWRRRRTCRTCMGNPTAPADPWSASMKAPGNPSPRCARRSRRGRANPLAAHPGRGHPTPGDRSQRDGAQRQGQAGQLALHRTGHKAQTRQPLSGCFRMADH